MAFTVPDTEIDIRATRAGGPGGQHVNKASTRIEVVWNVAASPSLTDDQRARLLATLESRLDSRGRLRVVADASRSQRRNLAAATERLQEIVRDALRVPKPRKKTRPSKAAVERRLQAKRQRADRKRHRRPTDDD
ncbi:MAG: alternative ribosome rescue aminoacyl-tRNA hydrolase ArfB [Gemmatimonadota bacterium]|nr:alternative ribosome rescue aminoacyl-tRNA hydrolase ArfB [Gemmatimonadota bacterium]